MVDSGNAGDGASQHTGRPTIRDVAAPVVHSSLSVAMRVGAPLFFLSSSSTRCWLRRCVART